MVMCKCMASVTCRYVIMTVYTVTLRAENKQRTFGGYRVQVKWMNFYLSHDRHVLPFVSPHVIPTQALQFTTRNPLQVIG